MSDEEKATEDKSGSLISHLVELRDRVVRMMLAILVIFLCLFYWANEIYTYLAEPLTRHMPEGSSMIAIDVASPFLTPFKLVLMLSVFLAMPVILYQLWAFVAPGLYSSEKRIAGPLLVSSIILFYAGMAFAYYIVFPLVFGFFTSIGPQDVSITTDIGRYLDFVLALFFGFGLAFEVPIATIILVAIGLTTPKKLGEMRPYVIVGAFIIGMMLTPPDIISQVLLAIPMWILFEAGVIASAIIFKEKLEQKEADDLAYDDELADDDESGNPTGNSDYQSLSDEEMDAELDRAEAEEVDPNTKPEPGP
ncbi:MAG: twin-arginine translocase subunit TatC [Gammaproteobacteria bacterium]|nr:twin-arginine translocase subunit TatC [Gammaproteobacteria bacterium]